MPPNTLSIEITEARAPDGGRRLVAMSGELEVAHANQHQYGYTDERPASFWVVLLTVGAIERLGGMGDQNLLGAFVVDAEAAARQALGLIAGLYARAVAA